MTKTSGEAHTDLKQGDWVDTKLPAAVRPYARLMRLDRPIGTWLLLMPCWWSLVLAGNWMPDLWLMFVFAAGAIVMRGAGCTINDIYDRNIDKKVERTKTRPLASGEISLVEAIIFAALLVAVGLLILLTLSAWTILLGAIVFPLILLYPLAKRVTSWPQLILGLAFNWGALMAWVASTGTIGLPAIALYIGGIFWTLAYDTIYACQDCKDDCKIGVKSLALLLGDCSKVGIGVFYATSLTLIAYAGYLTEIGKGFYVVLGVAALHCIWLLTLWDKSDPESSLKVFKKNRDFAFLILAAIWIGKFM